MTSLDDSKARGWLHNRLDQAAAKDRIARLESTCNEFADKPIAQLTERELERIWVDLNNGVSDLPSTSANLFNANRPEILRSATKIAQMLTDPPGTRLVKLCQFFRANREKYNQLPQYVRAVALYDPANAPTVTAYRGLTGAVLSALGYTGSLTAWEIAIQAGDDSTLNPAIAFAFETIRRLLPDSDIYVQAIGLELLPGYVKDQMRSA